MDPPALEHVWVWRYRQLRTRMSRSEIDRLVRGGRLVRLRKGSYLDARTHHLAAEAARHGGRVDCLSLLRMLGVFVRDDARLHVQMDRSATRVPPAVSGQVRHWRRTKALPDLLVADPVEAIAQACRCQEPLWAIATLDSALHAGVLTQKGLDEVFELLPHRFTALRRHIDGRAEAGSETILRILLRRRGWRVDVQVRLDGVGRVDLLVEGWLIVECDSESFHGGWDAQRRDRRRDLRAAALGHAVLRPIAEDIFWHVEDVLAAVEGVLRSHGSTPHIVGRTTAVSV